MAQNCLVYHCTEGSDPLVRCIYNEPDPHETMPVNLTLSFFGDQGLDNEADQSRGTFLKGLVNDDKVQAFFHAGDFDYGSNPTAWDNMLTTNLGADFPYFSAIGNHDYDNWTNYNRVIYDRYQKFGAKCYGDIGRNNVCTFKGFSFVISSVGTGMTYTQLPLTFDDAFNNYGGIWRMCMWHKNQHVLQLGYKIDEVGWEAYNDCVKNGAFIINGHEHSYARSKTITHYSPAMTDYHEEDEILNAANSSFLAVVGTGGREIRACSEEKDQNPWWGKAFCSPSFSDWGGALVCVFNLNGEPRKAYCYFKAFNGSVMDSFYLRSENTISTCSTNAPIDPPVETPADLPTEEPSSPPTDSPTVPPTRSPTRSPTPPTRPPTEARTDPPVEAPTNTPTAAPYCKEKFPLQCEAPEMDCISNSPDPLEDMPVNLTLAFYGDQGVDDNVLNGRRIQYMKLLKEEEGVSAIFHAGDFDYNNNPTLWDDRITMALGSDFPYFSTIGNHDQPQWLNYRKKIHDRWNKFGAKCYGDVGRDNICSFKGFTFVLSGVGTSSTWETSLIEKGFNYFGGLWRMCMWHKNQHILQVGEKSDEVGWDPYNACKDAGAFIINGHEHSYCRSKTISSYKPESPDFIDGSGEELVTRSGESWLAVAGTAGMDIRPCSGNLRYNPWWSSVLCSPDFTDMGALICKFNLNGVKNRAYCYFLSNKKEILDSFYVTSKNDVQYCGNDRLFPIFQVPTQSPTESSPTTRPDIVPTLPPTTFNSTPQPEPEPETPKKERPIFFGFLPATSEAQALFLLVVIIVGVAALVGGVVYGLVRFLIQMKSPTTVSMKDHKPMIYDRL
eukprot:TRINITY_DN4453_c0_g1_i1.p1 TRINITY_DN4453_c0_g1~~TRINITY_DN4453_c0_g1_i1.p1  ORF type:complete len:853 (+),score=184.51 TRINITY_DN4453_c0_g1_i1:53-2560(+)